MPFGSSTLILCPPVPWLLSLIYPPPRSRFPTCSSTPTTLPIPRTCLPPPVLRLLNFPVSFSPSVPPCPVTTFLSLHRLVATIGHAVRHWTAICSGRIRFRGVCNAVHCRRDCLPCHHLHYLRLPERCCRCTDLFTWNVAPSHNTVLPSEI